jgi:hypothetical protein
MFSLEYANFNGRCYRSHIDKPYSTYENLVVLPSLAAAQAMPISASVGFMTGIFLGLKH